MQLNHRTSLPTYHLFQPPQAFFFLLHFTQEWKYFEFWSPSLTHLHLNFHLDIDSLYVAPSKTPYQEFSFEGTPPNLALLSPLSNLTHWHFFTMSFCFFHNIPKLFFWLNCKFYHPIFIILWILLLNFYFCKFYHPTFIILWILPLEFLFHEFNHPTFNISQILPSKFLTFVNFTITLVTKQCKKSLFYIFIHRL